MKNEIRKLTLDRPAVYQIKVPGKLDERWFDWSVGMTISVEGAGESPPVTTLTGKLDQAALQGLLRQLYSLGIPIISAICINGG